MERVTTTTALESGRPRRAAGPARVGGPAWLFACALLPLLTAAQCDTNTDPAKVPPTVRVQVFGTVNDALVVDVVADATRQPAPPPVQRFAPSEMRTVVTGSQLDKGMGTVSVVVRLLRTSRDCGGIDPGNTPVTSPATDPGSVTYTKSAPGPQGIVVLDQAFLQDYLGRIRCPFSYMTFQGVLEVTASARNVAGLVTTAPPIQLQPK